jgi:hypothetical protein
MWIRRIIGLAVVGWIASMVAGAIAAASMRRSLIPTTDESADEVVLVAIFGPLAFRSTAGQFRGGLLECWYGGGVLDLRDATLAPDGATLRVRAVFGGGQILVPAEWRVISSVRGLGGLTDIRPAKGYAEDAPELVIEGILIGGGFAVTSEVDEDEEGWLSDAESKLNGTKRSASQATQESLAATETEFAPAD